MGCHSHTPFARNARVLGKMPAKRRIPAPTAYHGFPFGERPRLSMSALPEKAGFFWDVSIQRDVHTLLCYPSGRNNNSKHRNVTNEYLSSCGDD